LVLLALSELLFFAHDNLVCFDAQALLGKVSQIDQIYRSDPGDYRISIDHVSSNSDMKPSETVHPNLPLAADYAAGTSGGDIGGYNPLFPLRYARFIAASQDSPLEPDRVTVDHLTPELGLTRLRYRLQERADGFLVKKFKGREMPRAVLVGHWQTAPGERITAELKNSAFDFRKTAWLESPPGIALSNGPVKGQAVVRDISTDAMEIKARLSRPALLVLSDNYSRGWRARSLLKTGPLFYPVLTANGFQRAVALTAGDHDFILEYRPPAYVAGKWISLVSLGLWLGLGAWALFFRRRPFVTRNPTR
jgi:hypothetical protein